MSKLTQKGPRWYVPEGFNINYDSLAPATQSGPGDVHATPSFHASVAEKNVQQPEAQARLQRQHSRIGDDYRSVTQVTEDLAQAGLESSNLTVGIDFTKSNKWTGCVKILPAVTRRLDSYASESSQPEATRLPDAYAESSFWENYERSSLEERFSCAICMDKLKDLAFGCGHQTCYDCGENLVRCPMCQQHITTRIRLY